jgi:site-specific DNA recombinase
MPRPAVYLRVSSEQQRERVSISSQEDALRRWLQSQAYDPDEDVLWYRDDGVSGETPIGSRGDGQRLVHDIRAKVIGGFIAVFSISRISREASDFFAFRRLLSDHNLVLIGVSEGASTGDEGGDMAVSINALFADWSNKALRKASKAGLMRAAREGKWVSRPPYGYRVEDRRLSVYPSEAAVVRDIFRWYTESNMGALQIANRLNDLKIASPGESTWQTNMVLRILHNPVYAGRALYNVATTRNSRRAGRKPPAEHVEVSTPAIVPESVYNRARTLLARSAKRSGKTGAYDALCLLSRVRCALCGRNYYRASNGKGKGFYRHDTYKDNHKECQNANFQEAAPVDEDVWSKVLRAVRDPEGWADELEAAQGSDITERSDLEQTNAALADVAAQLERLEEAYVVHGQMSGESYAKLARDLRDKDERLRARAYELRQSLESIEKQAAARQSTISLLRELREIVETATTEERAFLMDRLVETVYLDATGEAPLVRLRWAVA